jgi:glycosyltransferase involved in cell wall biosynthesis
MLEAEPDVVHVNGLLFPELIRGVRAALPARTALVVQDHGGFDPAAASALARAWIRRGLAAADAVLVSSPGQADTIRRRGLTPRETMVADVMESSTSLGPVPRREARLALGMTGTPALLWVGRLNGNKDPITVLRGAAEWFRAWPTATLTMVFQSGDLAGSVQKLIASTPELTGRIALVGAVPNERLAEYYSAADLFVLGSHYEGSGYAAIEALACGAAPVITDIAPFRALTHNGSVGTLWEAGNPSAFAAALSRVMARPRADQRETARNLFERAFSWPVIGRRALAIYRDVMASRDRGRATAQTRRPA